MAIKQIIGTEDVPQLVNQIDDDNGSWWGGVRLAGATTIALAAGLAITALSSQVAQNVANSYQDEPGVVPIHVEEDYWQYQLPSKTDYFVAAQYDTPEVVPQSTFVPDEDAWQSPQPQAQVIQYAQPWAFAQDEVSPVITNAFDEDYWQNNVQPVLMTFAQMAPWAWDEATTTQQPAPGPPATGRSARLGLSFSIFR